VVEVAVVGLDLATVVRGDDLGEGAAGAGAIDFALEREAAVGLLSRSIASLLRVVFFTGRGGIGGVLRALASDAAVGANKPLEREGVGVLVPDSVRAGVLGVVGALEVVRRATDVVETTD